MRLASLLLLLLFSSASLPAQISHYSVKLTPDFGRQVLHGEETIEFTHDRGDIQWQKQPHLQLISAKSRDGSVALADESVTLHLRRGGKHQIQFEYMAAPHRGIQWFAGSAGFDTAFYCEAWMVCDISPAQRATMKLELVLPIASGLTAAGPGRMTKQWRDARGEHFIFERTQPVQTYLFSFGVAKLTRSANGDFILYAPDSSDHKATFAKTAEARAFLRSKAGVDLADPQYAQAFLPSSIDQESAGIALLPAEYLADLENEKDDVSDMTHELAHQWWGVLVGIRSWSDFWLNEGMAEFMTDVYLEQRKGKAAYDQQIAAAQSRMDKLRAEGRDRPLHWEGWKDAHEALGPLPYVKGALFLNRLRTELGDEKFWRGIQLYTTRNAGRLVDSQDFEQAMEEATNRNLKSLFDEAVYH